MPRRAPNLDGNHARITLALRACGWSVLSLAGVGNGCPDLLVGAKRVNVLLELKDDKKPPSARKLTPDEVTFLASWRGQYAVVENEVQAVAAVRAVLSGVFL